MKKNLVISILALLVSDSFAKSQKMVDCRLISHTTTECKPYSTKFIMTKAITTYDTSPKLIIQRQLPLPVESSITVVSVEDMIEKNIEVLEPIRYIAEKPRERVIEGNLSKIIPTVMALPSKEELRKQKAKKYPKYKVQKGDSLHYIAKRFDMDIKKLLLWNTLEDKSKIILGQEIIIPVMPQKFKLLNYKHKKKLALAKKKRLEKAKKRKLAKAKKLKELKRKKALQKKLYPSQKKQLKYGVNRKKFKRKLRIHATAYTSHRRQTDKTPFLAAWNNRLRPGMKSIAVSRDLISKYGIGNGKRVRISGLSGTYVVKDKMNKRFRKRIDIYMGMNRRKALRWGKRSVTIYW